MCRVFLPSGRVRKSISKYFNRSHDLRTWFSSTSPSLQERSRGDSCACVGFRTSSPGARSEGWPPRVKWDSTCTVVRIWVNWSDSLQYHIDSFVPRKLCFISTGKTTCDSDFVFYQS